MVTLACLLTNQLTSASGKPNSYCNFKLVVGINGILCIYLSCDIKYSISVSHRDTGTTTDIVVWAHIPNLS